MLELLRIKPRSTHSCWKSLAQYSHGYTLENALKNCLTLLCSSAVGWSGKYAAIVCSRPHVCRPSRSLSRGQCLGSWSPVFVVTAAGFLALTSEGGGVVVVLLLLVESAFRCCLDQDLKSVQVRHGAGSFAAGWAASAGILKWFLTENFYDLRESRLMILKSCFFEDSRVMWCNFVSCGEMFHGSKQTAEGWINKSNMCYTDF